jgi:diadenosine tetraphosphate (Ap4A) HIT family hydrolase
MGLENSTIGKIWVRAGNVFCAYGLVFIYSFPCDNRVLENIRLRPNGFEFNFLIFMPYFYSPLRNEYKKSSDGCPFCDEENINPQIILDKNGKRIENEHYFWIVNRYPRFEGHTMLVPKKHIIKIEDETKEEAASRHELLCRVYPALMKVYAISGVEVFLQTGSNSLSTVPHLHWHVLPSFPDEKLRGFEKMGYFDTKEPETEKVVLYPVKIKLAREDLKKALSEFL